MSMSMNIGRGLVAAMNLVGAAGRAANAVSAYRRPDDKTLRALGINPNEFTAKF